jgi:hypothetical protein
MGLGTVFERDMFCFSFWGFVVNVCRKYFFVLAKIAVIIFGVDVEEKKSCYIRLVLE